jgi:hypothetical protein
VLTLLFIYIRLVAQESVMSVVLFECRVLGDMKFWLQMMYYLGLQKTVFFNVRCLLYT